MTDKEYFADLSRESNTSLGWLDVSPAYYSKRMRMAEEGLDDSSAAMDFGSAVHVKLLEQNEFSKRYVVVSEKAPSNSVQKKFCDFIIASKEINDKTLALAYKMSYATSKMKPEKILERAKDLYKSNKKYISQEQNKDDRKPLTQEQYQTINTIENAVRTHDIANSMIYNECEGCDVYNELPILYTFNNVEMKSKLDRLIVDVNKKIIYLIDIKTHSVKSEERDFKESFKDAFEYRKYNRQLGLYTFAINEFFKKNYPDQNIIDFDIETYIVAIKSNFDNEVRVFRIPEYKLFEGLNNAKKLTDDLKYYRKNGFSKRRELIEDLY